MADRGRPRAHFYPSETALIRFGVLRGLRVEAECGRRVNVPSRVRLLVNMACY